MEPETVSKYFVTEEREIEEKGKEEHNFSKDHQEIEDDIKNEEYDKGEHFDDEYEDEDEEFLDEEEELEFLTEMWGMDDLSLEDIEDYNRWFPELNKGKINK